MTATTVAAAPLTPFEKRAKAMARVWRCQFCATGHHGSCPGAVRVSTEHGPILWLCRCTETGHPGFPYCLTCRHDRADELVPEHWMCVDRHACAARVQRRKDNGELFQMLQRCKSAAALKRRAERMNIERALTYVDPDQDERIDELMDRLDQLSLAKKKSAPRKKAPPRSTSGKCECCGEPTRGGRFLPGHDAKLASALKKRVESGDMEAYAEMKRRNWLSKLPVALRVELVHERANTR
jgi:hypothetical protein